MDVALCQCEGKALLKLVTPTAVPKTSPPTTTTTTSGACKGFSFMSFCLPWWLLWLLLALCLLCLCGLLFCIPCKGPSPKGKARSWTRISEGTQTPAAAAAARETSFTEAQTTVAMVQPFETVVEVVPRSETAIRPVSQTLFDMIDTNHDGVLTRQELAAAGAANTQSYMIQQQTSVLPSEPIQNMPPMEPVIAAPSEPIMNRSSQGLMQGTVQVVPTTQMMTETQVLQPMQAVQGQQMDLLTVTPWGYSVNHMAQ